MTVLLFLKCFCTFFVATLLIGVFGFIFLVGFSAALIKLSITLFLAFLIYAIWYIR